MRDRRRQRDGRRKEGRGPSAFRTATVSPTPPDLLKTEPTDPVEESAGAADHHDPENLALLVSCPKTRERETSPNSYGGKR